MTEDEVDLCIQTLIDIKLLDVSRIDQTWMLTPNGDRFQKYFDVPISKVIESDGIPMAKEVTWNVEEEPKQEIADMSEQEITAMILRLQAQLNEKQQVKKLVKNNEPDDLPF